MATTYELKDISDIGVAADELELELEQLGIQDWVPFFERTEFKLKDLTHEDIVRGILHYIVNHRVSLNIGENSPIRASLKTLYTHCCYSPGKRVCHTTLSSKEEKGIYARINYLLNNKFFIPKNGSGYIISPEIISNMKQLILPEVVHTSDKVQQKANVKSTKKKKKEIAAEKIAEPEAKKTATIAKFSTDDFLTVKIACKLCNSTFCDRDEALNHLKSHTLLDFIENQELVQ